MFKNLRNHHQESKPGAPLPPATAPAAIPLSILDNFTCRFLEGVIRGICDIGIEVMGPTFSMFAKYIK